MGDAAQAVNIAFHGVRGSTPCCCPTLRRYGGNTSCVSIESEGADPIVLDCGTGIRMFGASLADEACEVALEGKTHYEVIKAYRAATPAEERLGQFAGRPAGFERLG